MQKLGVEELSRREYWAMGLEVLGESSPHDSKYESKTKGIVPKVTYAFFVWDLAESIIGVYAGVVDQKLCEFLVTGLVELVDRILCKSLATLYPRDASVAYK